ncbi:MAG: LacI family DNA-binding transcriptional regulator [Treponema sp.]|jgi:LacI family sucrose operon transcriptional repressor|nr:LacI family DNA-binding transcriptional regulator [Treponema sp.]
MPTIKDVAKRAGVSVATVSRVFNNRGYLSDEIKQKVARAMEELNYHPNDLARSLHSQKSNLIGLIVPTVKNPYFGELTHYIESYAYEKGYKILICNSLRNEKKEHEYIIMLKRSQVDGIIMGSHVIDTNDYHDLELPIISLDRQLGPSIPYICSDNYQGGVMAAEHLFNSGCRNLIHFCDGLDVPLLANQRTAAFIDTCEKLHVPYQRFEFSDSQIIDFYEEPFIRDVLEKNPACDGVFASNDISAATVIGVAQAMGKKVPKDIRVIGFDGIFLSGVVRPKLTTIKQPIDAIASYAVEYLLRMMGGEAVPTQTILPVALVEGESG